MEATTEIPAVFTHHVSCAECREDLFETPIDDIAENPVYEFDGELDYIELYHVDCAPAVEEPDYERLSGRDRDDDPPARWEP